MKRSWRTILLSDTGILILLALARILLQVFLNGQYGFHRDELATLDDARYLAWGYVAYPPVTPAIARLALELFGLSLIGVRFFAVLAQAAAMVLTGLMVRDLGGGRRAQILGALAMGTTPASLVTATLFQYVTFDYLWWVLIAFFFIRLLKTEDPRWWLGVGAAIGLGVMTKYTIVFLVAGLGVGVLLTANRRYLLNRWLWLGAGLALLIVLPNLIWQIQHNFVSLTFLNSIHSRDVSIGRADGFLLDQIKLNLNPLTLYLVGAGLYFYFRAPAGQRFRALGWMYVVPLVLFMLAQGRGYYLSPAYPMLIAAGATWLEASLAKQPAAKARSTWRNSAIAILISTLLVVGLTFPLASLNSAWWEVTNSVNSDLREEIGWQDLTETVAKIYAALPPAEQSQTGILAGNYGEAGALNLYGPAHGLPRAISGVNSYWLRGYGDPPPQILIVVGYPNDMRDRIFASCQFAASITNRYAIQNEETNNFPTIYVCRGLHKSWPEFWKDFQYFG